MWLGLSQLPRSFIVPETGLDKVSSHTTYGALSFFLPMFLPSFLS